MIRQLIIPLILLRITLIVLLNETHAAPAIIDPLHSWDHFAESCFWKRHSGGSWASMYEMGTRVSLPPLIFVLLEPFCDSSTNFASRLLQVIVMAADLIGAHCIYRLSKSVLYSEGESDEAEMEQRTILSKDYTICGGQDGVIPGVLRPERGWVFGLPNKIYRGEEAQAIQASCDNKSNEMDEIDTISKNGALKENQKINGQSSEGSKQNETQPPIMSLQQLPLLSSVLYLVNPISILAAPNSFRSLWDMLLLLALYYASFGNNVTNTKTGAKCAFFLALATYVDAYYAVFLVPILLWRGLLERKKKSLCNDWKRVMILFVAYYGALHGLAFCSMGGNGLKYKKILVRTLLPNVAFVEEDTSGSYAGPSMGVHWYFFVQTFDRFRPYFTLFISGIPAVFVIPLIARLYRYPCVLAATYQLLWSIFRPTTTVHTLTLGFILLLLNPRTIVRMRDSSLISFFSLPVSILLFVTFHRMWLVTGNGNPNYIFFQCFAYGLFVAVITLDVVSATVKRDKVRRIVEKGDVKGQVATDKEKRRE